MSLLHLTDHNFKKEVLDSHLPVVVDFGAKWCGPCKMIAPAVEELAKEYAGRVKIGKLDIEESPAATSRYGIMSVPTLAFFKDGKIMSQASGAMSKADLKKRIEESFR
jgi:thioredoxin 1